ELRAVLDVHRQEPPAQVVSGRGDGPRLQRVHDLVVCDVGWSAAQARQVEDGRGGDDERRDQRAASAHPVVSRIQNAGLSSTSVMSLYFRTSPRVTKPSIAASMLGDGVVTTRLPRGSV